MKNYFAALLTGFMAVSTCGFTAEIAATENENIEVTSEMKDFKQLFGQALAKRIGISYMNLGFLEQNGAIAFVIQFQGDITLRQARSILIEAVETLQDVIEAHPELEGKFPGISSDPRKMMLVIDTYDPTLDKKEQFGVSSVILNQGWVYFMGISHVTGKETLMHKQTYRDAVQVAWHQKKR